MEQKKKIKIVIIVLAVLLGLSLVALGYTLVRNKPANNDPATVTVPDNLITSEEDTKPSGGQTSGDVSGDASSSAQGAAAAAKKAATISLYSRQPEENTAFQVGNMFPGDVETKFFRVQVSYHDKVTVHFKATVRAGYEKLAEVLQVRVKLLTTGETLYDGLMRDMPASVTHKLAPANSTTDELYYEITAYLDTSVGNEYQNKDLIADFKWWVEETGNLDNPPKTGDLASPVLWAAVAACAGSAMLILLVSTKRREEKSHG